MERASHQSHASGSVVGGSVSACLSALRNQSNEAQEQLCLRYRESLAAHARKWVNGRLGRIADEDDIAQEALWACTVSIRANRSQWVKTRAHWWGFLVTAAHNWALDEHKKLGRKKRGGGLVRGESAFIGLESSAGAGGIDCAPDPEPPLDRRQMAAESFQQLLASLRPKVRQVALLKRQGFSNREIACRLDIALVTVKRRLNIIRTKWKEIGD